MSAENHIGGMTAARDRVLSAVRAAQDRAADGDVAVVPEDVLGRALHLPFSEVRDAAHELADKGLIRIRRGVNYELYELV